MPLSEPDAPAPLELESLEQTRLPETLVEQLILKILYYRGELFGQGLAAAIGLKFSVIQPVVEALTGHHYIQVKRSLGIGTFGSVFALTEEGRSRARECMEENQYGGAAPVALAHYVEFVRRQRRPDGWLSREALSKAFREMVVTEQTVLQLGPAVSSGKSLLIYGKPGDGKTLLIESLNNIASAPIFLPHAIECQGHIIRVYDPIYHQRVEEEPPSVSAVSVGPSYDRRWVKCKRPFIVSGGELVLDMLDLRYNRTSKVYEAPFQLKANNGIYLIDDFGRQRATPAEVLNRWIVPMERRVDFLTFLTGGKMTVPFEAFLVFSTNLNPADLGDEAFLRRIQYKMLLRGPSETEFVQIFERCCAARRLPFPRETVLEFIERRYRHGKPFRRCHPYDLILHAWNLIHFERLPLELNEEILDRAFESCFLEEQEDRTGS
jgi:predicted ATPase with chaperone activity